MMLLAEGKAGPFCRRWGSGFYSDLQLCIHSREMAQRSTSSSSVQHEVGHPALERKITLFFNRSRINMILTPGMTLDEEISRHQKPGPSVETWFGALTNGPRICAVGCPRFLITSGDQDSKGKLCGPGFAERRWPSYLRWLDPRGRPEAAIVCLLS